ncbi:MAG TPA: HAMP domain-containing sensor histidine kinase [Sphingomonas sp.]|jgi:signal transduction histidine kinase|nr:HAMP domain-containing sensor histidine kinase [Sphingomonas sp.]
MNAPDPFAHTAVSHACVDSGGRLISAEPAIATLNRHAGGAIGEPLAVPAIATIARLARRLGIVVSRGVVVADEDADVSLWVRAQPYEDNVRLAISGWQERAQTRLPIGERADADFVVANADWRWETDASLRLTFVSLDAGTRHGFDALGLLGRPLTRLFVMGDDGEGGLPILDALARRKAFANQPAELRGTGTRVMLSASVRTDAQHHFSGFVGAVSMLAPLAERNSSLSQAFTVGLDSALRRPLGRIIGHADSIAAQADGPVEPTYTDYAADIASAGRHLLALIDDLVDMQAIERADFAPPAEAIDLADVARRAAGLLRVRAAAQGVKLVPPDLDRSAPAKGDFRRALQILVNLVGNAIRYAPRGSVVSVMVQDGADGVEAVVSDAGKGIAPQDQDRVFEKFARVDVSEPGGNGLGLYISRRLARAMGGNLTLDSAPGEGARFTLTLPADPARHQDQ